MQPLYFKGEIITFTPTNQSINGKSLLGKDSPDYNEEIFDVLHNDKKAIIRSAIGKSLLRLKP
ncbi:MAG: hypothetical protein WDO16_18410 [Bacteroidota bacterium]